MEWGRKIVGMICFTCMTLLFIQSNATTFLHVPDHIVLFESEWENEDIIHEKLAMDKEGNIETDEEAETVSVKISPLPEKKTNVTKIPDIKVIPGGDSIGVQLESHGVMVIGFHEIKEGEKRFSPAKKAGLEIGDRIVQINQKKINSLDDVVDVLEETTSESVTVHIERGNKQKEIEVSIHKGKDGNIIGAYIRQSASGVGTLTFYEPKTGKFGALGHVIADPDTKDPIEISEGKIMRSTVNDIEKGINGTPGEKRATIIPEKETLGKVTKNSPFGVFGVLDEEKLQQNKITKKALPIAFADEVKKGPAQLWTVVEGEKIEAFDIEIVQTVPQMERATKGMVIEVTDEKLIEKTGGIIQGMSGSPIIQDGKLVGAVTHVFVNEAKTGYASHIEWMLEEAGINTYKEERTKDKKTAS